MVLFLPDALFRLDGAKSITDNFGDMVNSVPEPETRSASDGGCDHAQGHFASFFEVYGISAPVFNEVIGHDLESVDPNSGDGDMFHVPSTAIARDIARIDRFIERFWADPSRLTAHFNDMLDQGAARMKANGVVDFPSSRLSVEAVLQYFTYCQDHQTLEGNSIDLSASFRSNIPRALLEGFMYIKLMRSWLVEAQERGLGLVRFCYGI